MKRVRKAFLYSVLGMLMGPLYAFPLDSLVGRLDPSSRSSPFEMNADNAATADVDPFGIALRDKENPSAIPDLTRILTGGSCSKGGCPRQRV